MGATLALGPVDDMDTHLRQRPPGRGDAGLEHPRNYRLAPGVLKAGRNLIAVRAIDSGGGGGTWGKAARQGPVVRRRLALRPSAGLGASRSPRLPATGPLCRPTRRGWGPAASRPCATA
ncbi:hypothetical protein ACRAWD_31410 [Caulobacter segnis]